MTNAEAKKILKAYIACESKQAHFECGGYNCDDNCPLLYEMGTVGEHKEAINMAIKALEQTQWIPVSKRLPKEGGDYFVTTLFEVGGKEPVREVRKNFFCILSKKWLYENNTVVAWMPLPKPYELQESEEVNG